MDDKKLIKNIFCANEQEVTIHTLSASQTGEIVATCDICGRVLKFPAGVTRKEFDKEISKHESENSGQVTQESIDKTLASLADEPEE